MKTSGLKKLSINLGLMLPIVLFLVFSARPNPTTAEETDTGNDADNAIAALLEGRQNHLLAKADFSKHADVLSDLYRLNNNQLLWLGETRAETNIEQALAMLGSADQEGLDPVDYDTEALKVNLPLALTLPQTSIDELAKFDTALSIALVRYASDLHHGRVNPQQLRYPTPFGNKAAIGLADLIKKALDNRQLAELPGQLQPKFKQYQQLKNILATFRAAPADADHETLVFQKPLRPGENHPQMAQLHERLITLGALPDREHGKPAEKTYNKVLQEGVKNFQRENGLKADGVIGDETAARLNQSLRQKISRIELAMERLRWLPDDIAGPMIIVNIPAFQLWAFNSPDDSDILNMKVIVGKALKNQTPVLFEEMKYLEFMPYWNIPKSIMDKEILPKLYTDFSYLQNQDIELVQRSASDKTESWDNIFDDIRRGRVRARQRPGKRNPLGKVKFIFPNKEDVYLHDTSTHSLFSRSRRDFSHGCVRVAEAEKLAEFVLTNQPESSWDSTAIQEAMSGSKTRRVTLKKPIPVLFFYATTFVDHNNQIHFYRDIYEQDAALEKALGKFPNSENDSLLTAKNTTSS
ncbi:L,D-transpeptidase family protein [Methylomonas sp. SURF-2]|uniref:L,D-transpeptidase family protein n=1 Tax=Methylomonas subterranea TaxID=2952225 RepID=A0ABT1TER0_9GAMM|nr:L,D-transpeptidase family protein [Methylomonas sp. SURF-2]MCQ8103946.1 L,D-transpeptidase family protein [Methylomonas sp. SURF-2]